MTTQGEHTVITVDKVVGPACLPHHGVIEGKPRVTGRTTCE